DYSYQYVEVSESVSLVVFFFFFSSRRRHTRFSRDWSSDVCSSDLQLLAQGDERALRLLRGLLAGRTQAELAEDEGISPSAVSQRVRNDGLAVIVAADEMLREVA